MSLLTTSVTHLFFVCTRTFDSLLAVAVVASSLGPARESDSSLADAVAAASHGPAREFLSRNNTVSTSGRDIDAKVMGQSLVHNQTLVAGVSNDFAVVARLAKSNPDGDLDYDDVHSWSSYIELSDTIFGEKTFDMSFLSSNTTGYDNQKSSNVADFFRILQKHPKLHVLLDLIDNPSAPGSKILRFFGCWVVALIWRRRRFLTLACWYGQ